MKKPKLFSSLFLLIDLNDYRGASIAEGMWLGRKKEEWPGQFIFGTEPLFLEMSLLSVIIGATICFSILCWAVPALFEDLEDRPYQVWTAGEWYRLLSGGLVHVNFAHLFFNMSALDSSRVLERTYFFLWGERGLLFLLGLYVGGVLVGGISGLRHRRDPSYRSVGASAGVCAIHASFALFYPTSQILFFGVFPLPNVLFLPAFLALSAFFSMRRSGIDHMAHLAGALYGVLFTLVLDPSLGGRFVAVFFGR